MFQLVLIIYVNYSKAAQMDAKTIRTSPGYVALRYKISVIKYLLPLVSGVDFDFVNVY